MQSDISIPLEVREELSVPIVNRKWLSLQKEFKSAYYCYVSQTTFPFYDRMFEMFSDYAEVHLNETKATQGIMNQTTDAEVTAFVKDLLDNSFPDALRCEGSSRENKPIGALLNESKSEASKVLKAIAELPKDSVSIQKAHLKIIPNTPFNRRYQLSTIINHRNAITSFKRSNSSVQNQVMIKKRVSSPYQEVGPDGSIEEYEIEALNECDFSEISDLKRLSDLKRVIEMPSALPSMIFEMSSVRAPESSGSSSAVSIIEQPSDSILEVPSCSYDSIDELREGHETSIVPKRLEWSDESFDLRQPRSNDETPAWFKNFMTRYDADMKKVDARMSAIDGKLNRILAQQAPATGMQRNILKVKKEDGRN